jgi:hypothetical protein
MFFKSNEDFLSDANERYISAEISAMSKWGGCSENTGRMLIITNERQIPIIRKTRKDF